MRAVNLLVQERSERQGPNKLMLAGAASSGAVLMLLGAAYVNAHSNVQRRQAALDELNAQLAALPPKQSTHTSNVDAKLVAEKAGRVAVLSSALSGRVRWDRLLRELSIVVPDDVWLDTLDATSPTPATSALPAAATPSAPGTPSSPPASSSPPAVGSAPGAPSASPTSFQIVGHTYNQDGVARLLIRLQLVPDLESVELVASQSAGDGATKSVQFTISAAVKTPGSGAGS